LLSWATPSHGGPSLGATAEPARAARVHPSTRFAVLAGSILLLAAVNLTSRLNRETITEWDESLYATSAWEMLQTGDWISTRFLGQIDYYNAKPPLNVWLIALAFKSFGVNPASLRLTSVASAWVTVALLMVWVRRRHGDLAGLFAGLVLTTCYAFIYVHAARTANTDALFTLLLLLTVITLDASGDRPWRRIWLGPILALVFLLRGMAVLMPVAIIAAVWWSTRRSTTGPRWPTAIAWLAFLVPTGLWAIARWRVDQWQFFDKLWSFDLVARSLLPLEDHGGGVLFYLNVLQKYQYDWLVAFAAVLVLRPPSREKLRGWITFARSGDRNRIVVGWWAILTLAIPTAMMTKVSWYLHPFYPVFALLAGVAIARAWPNGESATPRWRKAAVIGVVILACGVAEGRLVWNSVRNRNMRGSVQGLLQAERSALAGRRVFRDKWNHADRFVLVAIVGAEPGVARDISAFLRDSRTGDYLIESVGLEDPELALVASSRRHGLYRRR
jgi:4-amino-4-deoxy-L-arabinose transferase-like glycosyltransferase